MRTLGALALTMTLVVPALAADPTTDDQKAFYALGLGLAKQLSMIQPLSADEVNMITSGLSDALVSRRPS